MQKKKILAMVLRFEGSAALMIQQAAELKALLTGGENAQAAPVGPRRTSVRKAVEKVTNNRNRVKYGQ